MTARSSRGRRRGLLGGESEVVDYLVDIEPHVSPSSNGTRKS